jgi:CD2 antigen cytoplasmic tail-binding protein 2
MQATTQDPAKVYLNDLTGAANALLLKGEVEIYQSTKQDIRRHLPSSGFDSASTAKQLIEKQPPAKWEYMGNQDGAIHGPYTTEQMMAWVRTGYFVGAQRVKIRTIRDEAKEKTNQDDLLADLLEDDDEGETDENKTETARGDWQWSNGIDFGAYLPEPNC